MLYYFPFENERETLPVEDAHLADPMQATALPKLQMLNLLLSLRSADDFCVLETTSMYIMASRPVKPDTSIRVDIQG